MIHPPKFILVDGHSLAFRSYYAHAKGRDGGLRTSTGIPTSITFGFFKALVEVIESEKPQYLAIAFDLNTPTFRHEADETYKEGRPEAPEDFKPDLENLKELLHAFHLPMTTVVGFEADDVIGTLARQASAIGYQVKVLSGDQDLFQLIDAEKGVTVLHLSNAFASRGSGTGPIEYGPEQVKQKLGVLPHQVVDYKALCGDSSDNIPGVKGIGAKTAAQLLSTYGSLEGIYASLNQIKGAVKQKLEAGYDSARHSQYMAQIALNAPVDLALADCKLTGFDRAEVVPVLEKLEMKVFLNRLPKLQGILGSESEVIPAITKADSELAVSETKDAAMAESDAAFDSNDLWFFSAADTAASQEQTPIAITPQIIDTLPKLQTLVDRLHHCTNPAIPVAWDTETTALEPRDADLVGIGCCYPQADPTAEAIVAYIPLGHRSGGHLDKATVLELLRPILENANYPKVLQNAKFDRLVLRFQGMRLAGVVFDTMLASYLLNPDTTHNLGDLGLRHLGIVAKSYEQLVPKGKTIADLPIALVAHYCGMDVYTAFHLVPKLTAALQALPKLHHLLLAVEQPLEPVLAEMEQCGIRIDRDYLYQFSQTLEHDLAAIEQRAYAAAGEQFNLGSPKQLASLLFEKLKLNPKNSRKIKTGYSTDAATLEKLQADDPHPVVDAIVEYRTLSKLKSTYVDALPNLVRPETQRVHTDFNQAVTSTGRLSSSNPNLQNIPIRTAFSRQIRRAFLPEAGWLLVAADYSQIELRILAHLSQEPILLTTYQQNQDIHTLTAKLLFEKETITSEERRLAKVINFGVIYGMGAQRFAREAKMKTTEAKGFIERFNQRYPLVFGYLQQMQRESIANGYVETILGRRRYFNFNSDSVRRLQGRNPADIDLTKIQARDQYDAGLLRAAANAPIQGSSADIIKIAMVKLHEVIQPYRARLLLQVHDELVFEVPPEEWEELQPQIKLVMESAVQLSVPLVVDINVGQNWMEAK